MSKPKWIPLDATEQKKDESSHTINWKTIQVGAPPHPQGVIVRVEIESNLVFWKKKFLRGWVVKNVPRLVYKRIDINRDEVEQIIKEWIIGWDEYEAWRADLIAKAELYAPLAEFCAEEFARLEYEYVHTELFMPEYLKEKAEWDEKELARIEKEKV